MLNNKIKRKLRRMIKNVGSDAMLSLLPYSDDKKEHQQNRFNNNYGEEKISYLERMSLLLPIAFCMFSIILLPINIISFVAFILVESVNFLVLGSLEMFSFITLKNLQNYNLANFLTIAKSYGEKEVENFVKEETKQLHDKLLKRGNVKKLDDFTKFNKNTLAKTNNDTKVEVTTLIQPERKIEKQEIKNIDTKTKENDKEKTL